jgi:hypothetical protein
MQLKPITAIAVLLFVVASLSVAGCTSNTTGNTNQTTSTSATTSAATHDAFLEKYLAAYKNSSFSDKNLNFTVWEVTWINSTSAQVQETSTNETTNATWSYVHTALVFPTTQDATNYLDAMNKTAYSLSSTVYPSSGGAYRNVTGHAPTIYKYYEWNEGNPLNISEFRDHNISQLDNIIIIETGIHLH